MTEIEKTTFEDTFRLLLYVADAGTEDAFITQLTCLIICCGSVPAPIL